MSTRAKESDTECHLFRLPPELRMVIYELVLEDLGFAGLDEDVLEDEESDDGDELEEEDDTESIGTSEGVEGIDIEFGVGSEEDGDEDETPGYSPRLNRPPLDVCRLIRREAAPMYNSRLTLIAIEILEESARVLGAELDVDDGYEDTKWLSEVLLDDVSGLMVRTHKCMDVMEEEMRGLGMKLGVGAEREEVDDELREALDRFEGVCERLFEAWG